jgi:hypothetical protein
MKTETLSIYHLAFYPVKDGEILHCINIEAVNMMVALKKFYMKFPNIEPLYCHHKKSAK